MKRPEEQREYLRQIIPGHSWTETSDLFFERFGIRLTQHQVKNARQRLGVCSGTVGGRFEKGRVSPTKGKHWDDFMSKEAQLRSLQTAYKPGVINNTKHVNPIGHERVREDGYVEIKVKDSIQVKMNDNYRMKHIVVWEAEYGPVPEGFILVHIDKNRQNNELDNLVMVEKGVFTTITRLGLDWQDRESFRTCEAIARLCSAAYRAENKRKRKQCMN